MLLVIFIIPAFRVQNFIDPVDQIIYAVRQLSIFIPSGIPDILSFSIEYIDDEDCSSQFQKHLAELSHRIQRMFQCFFTECRTWQILPP